MKNLFKILKNKSININIGDKLPSCKEEIVRLKVVNTILKTENCELHEEVDRSDKIIKTLDSQKDILKKLIKDSQTDFNDLANTTEDFKNLSIKLAVGIVILSTFDIILLAHELFNI